MKTESIATNETNEIGSALSTVEFLRGPQAGSRRQQAGIAVGDSLKSKVTNTLMKAVIEHPFFHGMALGHLDTIPDGASASVFETGQILFGEGNPANQFYLIRSGQIALEAHEPGGRTALLQTLGAGDVMGWSWLFPPFAWHLRARAIERADVIVLNGAHLMVTAEHNPAFGYELMKRVAAILIQRLQAAGKLLVRQQFASPTQAAET
jgi:signal-transduction protein with cAMP-binding, CBS, and nucleotidyltransferase domain